MLFRILLVAGITLVVLTLSQRRAVAPPAYKEIGMKVCNPDGSEAGIVTEVAFKDNQSVYILNIPELMVENFKEGAPRARWIPTANAIVVNGKCGS
jgi:hypothetical protein